MIRCFAQTESSILAGVDETPRGYKEVHQRIGMWSPHTVKRVLNDLAQRGVVERRIEPIGRFGRSVYRLPQGRAK